MTQISITLDSDAIGTDEIVAAANIRAYVAELIGTMLFVLIGTGAVIVTGGGNLVAIALAHGIGIAVMVYATANYSGGHLNPAVTLAMIVTRNIKVGPGVVYIFMQMLGAALATTLLYVILFDQIGNLTDFGAHRVNTEVIGEGGALLLEILLTAALVSVIFATAVSKKGFLRSRPAGNWFDRDDHPPDRRAPDRRVGEPGSHLRPGADLECLRQLLAVRHRPGHWRGGRRSVVSPLLPRRL